MRNDPTDNGGLFIGRRPGTRKVRYRKVPEGGSAGRRRFDRGLAGGVLGVMALVNLTFWGPLPLGWLWVGGRVQYYSGDVSVAIFVAFLGMLLSLVAGLFALRWLDQWWILVRRAGGHDQTEGMVSRIFIATCAVGTAGFCAWFFLFSGAQVIPLGPNP